MQENEWVIIIEKGRGGVSRGSYCIKQKPCQTHAAVRTYHKYAIYSPLYYDLLRKIPWRTTNTRQMDNDEDKDDKEGIEVDYTRTSKEL
jgi:hypothetical protein